MRKFLSIDHHLSNAVMISKLGIVPLRENSCAAGAALGMDQSIRTLYAYVAMPSCNDSISWKSLTYPVDSGRRNVGLELPSGVRLMAARRLTGAILGIWRSSVRASGPPCALCPSPGLPAWQATLAL